MNRPPAFQFYPSDWFDFKVQRMSLTAQGAYIKLLCFMWKDSKDQCSILDNDTAIASALGTTVEQWLKLRAEMQVEDDSLFEQKSGKLLSKRLAFEVAKQKEYREMQSKKGKASAEQRFNRGSTVVQPEGQPEVNSSSPSSSPSSSSSLSSTPPLSLKEKETTTSSPAGKAIKGSPDKNGYHAAVVKAIRESYKQKFGSEYLFRGGQDGAHVKRLLGTYAPEQVVAMWCEFLRCKWDFAGRDGATVKVPHNITGFISRLESVIEYGDWKKKMEEPNFKNYMTEILIKKEAVQP